MIKRILVLAISLIISVSAVSCEKSPNSSDKSSNEEAEMQTSTDDGMNGDLSSEETDEENSVTDEYEIEMDDNQGIDGF